MEWIISWKQAAHQYFAMPLGGGGLAWVLGILACVVAFDSPALAQSECDWKYAVVDLDEYEALDPEDRVSFDDWVEDNGVEVSIDEMKVPAHQRLVCDAGWVGSGGVWGWLAEFLCDTEDVCFPVMSVIFIDTAQNRHTCSYDCNTTPTTNGKCDCTLKSGQHSGCPI